MPNSPRTLILLATCNGERYLREQLDSFLAQTDDAWDLLVSDDGSTDHTLEILDHFKETVRENHEVTIVDGPQSGCAQNFLSLIKKVPAETEIISFSDQDDVWLPYKIEISRMALEKNLDADLPMMYCAGSFICNADLTKCQPSPNFPKPPSFNNALVQSIAGGNTMMFNQPAIRLLQDAAQDVETIVFHDWWAYQIMMGCGGHVKRDGTSLLYYRQHASNVVGSNQTFRSKLARISFILANKLYNWNNINIQNLRASHSKLTPEAQVAVSYYSAARSGCAINRIRNMYHSGATRQRNSETIALYLMCLAQKM